MSRRKIICLLLFVAAALPCFAYPKWRKLPDETIETPVGRLVVTDLKAIHVLGLLSVQGELVNETPKSWDLIAFALEGTDKNGKVTAKTAPSSLITDPNAFASVDAKDLPAGARIKLKFDVDGVKADGGTLQLTFKYAYGEYPLRYKVALSQHPASDDLTFRDDSLALVFALTKNAMTFSLQNRSDVPIKVDWNAVSFVSPGGSAQGVIHSGVKLADRTATKAPSMVPPHARLDDEIVPVGNIELIGADWVTHPLLPAGPSGEKLVGNEFSIFMPLDIGGTTKNYSFVFKIIAAE